MEQPWRAVPDKLAAAADRYLGSGVRVLSSRIGRDGGRETAEPEKIMPRAINSVVARIAIFYVGSVALLALLLPYTAYKAGESPFVTFFSKIGFHGAGDLMNIVVLTAALSSLNAGLYSTGRVMHSIAMSGSAPRFTARMSKSGVPYGGIVLTAVITLFGVALNAFKPGEAFEIVLNMSALGIIAGWATIVLCQLRLHKLANAGIMQRPRFRMPFSPTAATSPCSSCLSCWLRWRPTNRSAPGRWRH